MERIIKEKKTSRIYSYIDGEVKTVYEENGEYYFNKRIVFNRFVKEYIPAEKVICLNRVYAKAKSFPLSRKIYTIANSTGGPISPYICVLYVANKAISDNSKLKPHGNLRETLCSHLKGDLGKGKKWNRGKSCKENFRSD